MLSRGGPERAAEKREKLRTLLQNTPYPSREILERLDREFIRENLSPGGSADLLALCWLLYYLKKEEA
jgi:holo-ACP synthase/triphosphoribosyl-dephospho-CoA synthase